MQQLFFKFPIKPAYLAEDFFVSSANTQAFAYLNQWPNWDSATYSKIFLLYGEKGCGKTHLAHIWQKPSDAKIIKEIDLYNLYSLINHKALILEDIEKIDEELLLHLINFSHENLKYLLLTSNLSPKELNFQLPDLRSRILTITSIAINKPEAELLKAVLLKHLSDRQLKVHPATLDYIILRIDRSFNKLMQFIEELTQISDTSKRPITIPLVKEILKI